MVVTECRLIVVVKVVVVLTELKHEVFTREGKDLAMTITLPLSDAIAGTLHEITTLDGRSIVHNVSHVVR